jgi:MFS family permease
MSEAPVVALTPAQRTRALGALGLAFGVLALDVTMVAGAAPRMAGDLRGVELLGWFFTVFLLGWTVAAPLAGKLADLHGRRPVLLGGLALHAAGAALVAPAASMEQAIACRVLAGAGAGAIMAASYTAAGDLYPPAQRARAQVLFAVVYLLASLIGPPLTGVLAGQVTWRAIFVVDILVALMAMAAIAMLFRERVARGPRRLDLVGAATLGLATGATVVALALVSRGADAPPAALVGLGALAVLGAAAFVWTETHVAEPLVPLGVFRGRVVLGACLVTLLMGSCIWSISAFVPLQVQGVLGGSTFEAALISAPYNATWLVTAVLAVPLLWRWGYRRLSVVGMAGVAAGFGILLLVGRAGAAPYALVLVGVGVIGLGLGFANTAVTVAVQNAVPWTQRATVTAVQQLFRQLGPSVTIALLQMGLNARLAAELAARGAAADVQGLGGGRVAQANALLAPELTARLTPAALEALRGALESALHQTFALLVGVGLLGCLAVWLLPGGHPAEHVYREAAPPAEAPAVGRARPAAEG